MNSGNKDSIFIGFFLGFLAGITFMSIMENKRKEKRIITFNNIKKNLNKGFDLDKKNLFNDWQHIYKDFDVSYNKLKQNAI